jgi:hypothetical protein
MIPTRATNDKRAINFFIFSNDLIAPLTKGPIEGLTGI